MADDWIIRLARASELPRLADIERLAGARFDTIPELADVPEVLMPPGALVEALARDQVWVAAALADDAPVGFAYANLLEDAVHLEELDVLPDWGRRGIGQRLIETVIADARTRGRAAVTLTTFRNVSWNAPFYARLGFRIVEPGTLSPGLAALVELEERRGLPARLRVAMRYPLAGRAGR